MEAVMKFLKEVRVELRKVSWPTRTETTQYTLVVIGVSVAVMLFLGGLDYLFSYILNTFVFK